MGIDLPETKIPEKVEDKTDDEGIDNVESSSEVFKKNQTD